MRIPREKIPGLVEAAERAAAVEERTLFAYLFGSAVEEDLPTIGDLDVAVYTSEGDIFKIAADMGTAFSRLTGLPGDFLDVRDLKEAPPSAAMKIVKTGRLLFCRDPLEHAEFIERLSNEYRQIQGLLREAYGPPMKVDHERLRKYCMVIQKNLAELDRLLAAHSEGEILRDRFNLAALKYFLIKLADAIAKVIVHLMARLKGEMVENCVELIEKADEAGLLPPDVLRSLKPLFWFRNALIHQFQEIDDLFLIHYSREGLDGFREFVNAVEKKFI